MINKLLFLLLLILVFGCSSSPTIIEDAKIIDEVAVININLPKPISDREFEASGLAWFENKLVFLPQYPHLFSDANDGVLFYSDKSDIKSYISGEFNDSLVIHEIPFIAAGLDDFGKQRGSGYEAIAFNGNDVYVAIESIEANEISSYLVKGKVVGDLDSIVLDASTLTPIKSNTNLNNMGEEAITFWEGNLYAFHEANGLNLVDTSKAVRTNFKDVNQKITFPHIEYRITDATATDDSGYFWTFNYLFPGDLIKLKPAADELEKLYGIGETNNRSVSIERLVQFEFSNNSIKISDRAPIYLKIIGLAGRNWEGIVKLDQLGFLVITDYFPDSQFGFVPFSDF